MELRTSLEKMPVRLHMTDDYTGIKDISALWTSERAEMFYGKKYLVLFPIKGQEGLEWRCQNKPEWIVAFNHKNYTYKEVGVISGKDFNEKFNPTKKIDESLYVTLVRASYEG
jgi:hypothetical protein